MALILVLAPLILISSLVDGKDVIPNLKELKDIAHLSNKNIINLQDVQTDTASSETPGSVDTGQTPIEPVPESSNNSTSANSTNAEGGQLDNSTNAENPSNESGNTSNSTDILENPDNSTDSEDTPDNSTNTQDTDNDSENPDNSTEVTDEDDTKPDPDAIQCPVFKFDSEESSDCLDLDDDDNTLTLHPCNSSSICSFSLSNFSTSSCVAKPNPPSFPKPKRGNSTENCTSSTDCKEGLVCLKSKCKNKRTEDTFCSLIDECEQGTICNKGRCVEYFSVRRGEKADYSIACQSGILLNGTCQNSELTSGSLPKPCKKHADCRSKYKVAEGECVCVLDKNSSSYCRLHRSDEIALKHLVYTHEELWYQAWYYTVLYNNYPVYLFAEDWFWKNNKQLVEQKQAEELGLEEGSFWGMAWGVLFWVIS